MSPDDLPATDSLHAADFDLLRAVSDKQVSSQRELASTLGMSLGKTNFLLRSLLAKGWVKVQNFRRNDNKLGYLYLLTPSGIAERSRLTRAFLAQKEREYIELQAQIARLRDELAHDKVEG